MPGQGAIRQVVIGDFAYVVKSDGSVVGWGQEEYPYAARPVSPRKKTAAPEAIALPGKVRQMAVGRKSAYALLEDGTVVAWGGNDIWQLGNAPTGVTPPRGGVGKTSETPVLVAGLKDIVQIAAGGNYGMALDARGDVFVWGAVTWNGKDGVAGAAVRVEGLQDIVEIAAGYEHRLALDRGGRVWSWGETRNEWGELGREAGSEAWRPGLVAGLENVISIAASGAGPKASGAVKKDGTVWVWGGNNSSQMGNGQNVQLGQPGASNPKPMMVKGVVGAKKIVMGAGHVAALLRDGTLRMWGHDGWGQIGIGTGGGYQDWPKQTKITGVAAVYLGGARSAAVRTDGTLWVWGPSLLRRAGVWAADQKLPMEVKLP